METKRGKTADFVLAGEATAHEDKRPTDPVSPAVRSLLRFYKAELAEAQFPGVSASSLQAQADRVAELAQQCAQVQAQLETARRALVESQRELVETSHQALAYARVFAAQTPKLLEQLSAIQLDGPNRTKRPRKRRVHRLDTPQPGATGNADDAAEQSGSPEPALARPRSAPAMSPDYETESAATAAS